MKIKQSITDAFIKYETPIKITIAAVAVLVSTGVLVERFSRMSDGSHNFKI